MTHSIFPLKTCDIGQEILGSIRAIKRGEGRHYRIELPYSPKVIRERMNLGPSAFASLLGVSLRTVRYWEEGTRQPSSASKALLAIAAKRPDVLLDVMKDTGEHS